MVVVVVVFVSMLELSVPELPWSEVASAMVVTVSMPESSWLSPLSAITTAPAAT